MKMKSIIASIAAALVTSAGGAASLRFHSSNSTISSGIWFTDAQAILGLTSLYYVDSNPKVVTTFERGVSSPFLCFVNDADDIDGLGKNDVGSRISCAAQMQTAKGVFRYSFTGDVVSRGTGSKLEEFLSKGCIGISPALNLPAGTYTVNLNASCYGLSSASASRSFTMTSSSGSLVAALGCEEAVEKKLVSFSSPSPESARWLPANLGIVDAWSGISGFVGKGESSVLTMNAKRPVYAEFSALKLFTSAVSGSCGDDYLGYRNYGKSGEKRLFEFTDQPQTFKIFLKEGNSFSWVYTRDSSELSLVEARVGVLDGVDVKRMVNVSFNMNGGRYSGGATAQPIVCVPGNNYNYIYETFGEYPFPRDPDLPPEGKDGFMGWFNEDGEKVDASSIVPEDAEDHVLTALWGTPDEDKPNLVVLGAMATASQVNYSDSFKVKCTVFNEGKKAAVNSVTLFEYGDNRHKSQSCAALSSETGYKHTITFYGYTLGVGTHTIRIVADGLEAVDESSETDNTVTLVVTVVPDPQVYTVTYDPGAHGSGTRQSVTKAENEGLTLMGAIFTRADYTQTGWSVTDGGARAYGLGATYSANASITLYPFWTAKPKEMLTITFDANGGTVSPVTKTIEKGQPVGALPTPVKTSHTWNGWWTARSGGTKISSSTVPTASTTYYAHWTETNPANLSISSVTACRQTVYLGETFHLRYMLKNSGRGSAVASTASITDANGRVSRQQSCAALAAGATQDYRLNIGSSSLGLGSHVITVKADYYGEVSESSESDNTRTIVLTVISLPTSSTTVDWQFHAKSGNSAPVYLSKSASSKVATTTFTEGETIYAQINFWNAIKRGTSGEVRAAALLDTGNGSQWTWSDLGAGTIAYVTDSARNGAALQNLPAGTYTLEFLLDNARFHGGSYVWYEANKLDNARTIEFTVVPKKSYTYTLRLHRNNSVNDGATAGRTLEVGVSRALPKLSELGWTRSGYTFAGWATSASAARVQYSDGQNVKNLATDNGATVHLYAVWKQNAAQTYVVRLHRNNSTRDGATAGRTYTIGKARALPKAQTELKWAPRKGYDFLGWSTSANATTAQYTDGQSLKDLTKTAGATVHLYAVWKAHHYIVRLHRNNSKNDGATTGRAFDYDQVRFLPTMAEIKWARSGYMFLGWSLAQSSATVKYADGLNVFNLSANDGEELHLWGVWKKSEANAYLLRLHRNNSERDGATAGRQLKLNTNRKLPTVKELGWARSDATFKGWATTAKDAAAGKVAYKDGATVANLVSTLGDTAHIYAVWQ